MSRKGNNTKSKYERDDRKHIAELIENLKSEEYSVAIFDILSDDPVNSYTINSNGVFLNLSKTSDETLDKVKKYLKKINRKQSDQIDTDNDVIPNVMAQKSDRTYKLSNYEKNILKQRNLKKVLNDDHEYKELKFSSGKKNTVPKKTTAKKSCKKEIDC